MRRIHEDICVKDPWEEFLEDALKETLERHVGKSSLGSEFV